MKVNLPYKFEARDYQEDMIKAFFVDKKKRFCCVWHRRAGKDRVWFNILITAAMQKTGLYLYTFPTLTQARKAIWEGRGKDGIRFLDQIPKELLKCKPNNVEMKIELVNGSIIRMGGTDRYDAWVGTNPLGVLFSEYSVQNPIAWDLIRPILAENGGWAAFVYTPRGHNHGYDMYYNNIRNDKWCTSYLTVAETKDKDGNPIVSEETIEDERIAGMSDDMIQQEFYCSFDAALRGAIFSLQLKRAHKEDRIKDFPIDISIPVYTFWDLGRHDATTFWFIQKDGEYWRTIYYYENVNQHINHYIQMMEQIRAKMGIVFLKHFLPHDAVQIHVESERSVLGYFEKFRLPHEVVTKTPTKQAAIEKGRVAFDKTIFHKTKCAQGIECLRSYRKEYVDKLKVYKEEALHDWASHGADSFLCFGQALSDGLLTVNDNYNGIRYNSVNAGKLI